MQLQAKQRLLAAPDLMSVLQRIARGSMVMGQQYANDPDKALIATKGKDWTKIGKLYDGPPGQCHWNVAKLYDHGFIDGIVIGYAHNFQGWHQHTWGLAGSSLVETTTDNKINDHWFGAKVNPEQVKAFVARCSKFRPGMGMIRTLRGGAL
jgi:hypothetical protein